jgi:hypothetical protein
MSNETQNLLALNQRQAQHKGFTEEENNAYWWLVMCLLVIKLKKNQLSSSFPNAQLPKKLASFALAYSLDFVSAPLVLPKYGPFYRFCFIFYVCTDMLPCACVQQPKLQRISWIKQKFKGMWRDRTLCSMKRSHRKEVLSYPFTSVAQSHDLAHWNF